MAANGGRYRVSHSAQVCTTCKVRKKKCDKVLPRCGYCVKKGLYCAYSYEAQSRNAKHRSYSTTFSLFASQTIPSEPVAAEANLYRQVLQLIHETGQFVDDISTRYFQGLHRYLPICSRSCFHKNLITLGAIPSADFSILLLTICLTVSSSSRSGTATEHANKQSLYLNTKSLLIRAQESYPPSLPLIQSHLLLAVYDYTHGRPEEAFVAIAGCARMAYAARIHLCHRSPSQEVLLGRGSDVETHLDPDGLLRAEEAANTWWGIVVCERTFFCEVMVPEQPLVTTIPSGDSLLPTEPDTLGKGDFPYLNPDSIHAPYISVSCIDSFNVGGFGRAAQAAWLLDKVFESFEIPDLDSKLARLQGLDITIQTFLSGLMQQCYANEKSIDFCQAIAITIRALFKMHWHITRESAQTLNVKCQLLEDWYKRSHAALDTATKMVLNIAEAQRNSDMVAPSLPYIIRAALEHIYGKADWKDDSWLRSAEERLRTSLDRFNQGRSVHDI